jgi:hypothetical protein
LFALFVVQSSSSCSPSKLVDCSVYERLSSHYNPFGFGLSSGGSPVAQHGVGPGVLLDRERKGCTFSVNAMSELLYGGAKVYNRADTTLFIIVHYCLLLLIVTFV